MEALPSAAETGRSLSWIKFKFGIFQGDSLGDTVFFCREAGSDLVFLILGMLRLVWERARSHGLTNFLSSTFWLFCWWEKSLHQNGFNLYDSQHF